MAKVQPALAESWIVSDDQLDYIFTIRPSACSATAPSSPRMWSWRISTLVRPGQLAARGRGLLPGRAFSWGSTARRVRITARCRLWTASRRWTINTVLIHLNGLLPDLLAFLSEPAFAILHPGPFQREAMAAIPRR